MILCFFFLFSLTKKGNMNKQTNKKMAQQKKVYLRSKKKHGNVCWEKKEEKTNSFKVDKSGEKQRYIFWMSSITQLSRWKHKTSPILMKTEIWKKIWNDTKKVTMSKSLSVKPVNSGKSIPNPTKKRAHGSQIKFGLVWFGLCFLLHCRCSSSFAL